MKYNITSPMWRVRTLDYPPREYNISTRSYVIHNFNYHLITMQDFIDANKYDLHSYNIELFAV